jgi:hypothetical protein
MEPTTWLTRLAIYGLAVFRLSRLISLEEGPAGLFEHLRRWCGVEVRTTKYVVYELDEGTGAWGEVEVIEEQEVAETASARFISCPLCTSVWLALPAAASLWLGWLFGDVVASWLAIAGITVLLHRDD